MLKKKKNRKKKVTLRDVMSKLKLLNERGVINALSIQYHYMNTSVDYTYVSFRILRDNNKKEEIWKNE